MTAFDKAWGVVKDDDPDVSPYAGTSKCPCRRGYNPCDDPKCNEWHKEVVKMPFEDHDWAQGSETAENRYRELESQVGEAGADEAYSGKDLVEVMTGFKELVAEAEGGMSGMSTRNAYGAYMSLIPRLAEQVGGLKAAATYLLMAGANRQGISDAMKILEGNY